MLAWQQCRVTTIDLSGCDELTQLRNFGLSNTLETLKIGDLPKVTNIFGLCDDCPSLVSVSIGHLPQLEEISGKFLSKCPNLEHFDFSVALAEPRAKPRALSLDKSSVRGFLKGSPCLATFDWAPVMANLDEKSVKCVNEEAKKRNKKA